MCLPNDTTIQCSSSRQQVIFSATILLCVMFVQREGGSETLLSKILNSWAQVSASRWRPALRSCLGVPHLPAPPALLPSGLRRWRRQRLGWRSPPRAGNKINSSFYFPAKGHIVNPIWAADQISSAAHSWLVKKPFCTEAMIADYPLLRLQLDTAAVLTLNTYRGCGGPATIRQRQWANNKPEPS